MEWGAAIVTALGLVLWGLKQWQANQPQRDREGVADDDQELRNECNDLDAAAVSVRIDGVLNPAAGDPARVADGGAQTGATGPE